MESRDGWVRVASWQRAEERDLSSENMPSCCLVWAEEFSRLDRKSAFSKYESLITLAWPMI